MIDKINKIILFALLAILPIVITEDKGCEYLFSHAYLLMTGFSLSFYLLRSQGWFEKTNN